MQFVRLTVTLAFVLIYALGAIASALNFWKTGNAEHLAATFINGATAVMLSSLN